MRQRIRKLSGLQETFIDLDKGKRFQLPTPTVIDKPVQEVHNHGSQEVESYHPKIYEVFSMSDNNIEQTSSHRAVGVDIGTGFISCAEKEADQMEKAEVVLEWVSNRFNCPLDELRFAYENHITSKWLEDNNLYYSNGKLRNRNEQM